MKMDNKFSAEAFASQKLNSEAAKKLADLLTKEIEQELLEIIKPQFLKIVEKLNSMGHTLVENQPVNERSLAYHDVQTDNDNNYSQKLHVAFNLVISTGYAHLWFPENEDT